MKTDTKPQASGRLREAFPSAPLDIEQGGAWSSYLDADDFEATAAHGTWTQLDAQFLEHHHDAISYAPPSLFTAMLPAWLAALLADGDELDMLPYFFFPALTPGESDDDAARFHERVGLLNSAQKAAVAQALQALAGREDYADHQDDIQNALSSYWSVHLR